MSTRFVAVALLVTALSGQELSFETLAREYDYDRGGSPSVHQAVREKRSGVTVFDYSYDSPKGGRAPALLVVPDGRGPFAVILFSHWMMPGSPRRNKTEFVEEAVALARAGAICLLLDSPLVRPGITEDPDPLNGQSAYAQVQMATDWRRGLDLLLARRDVDAKRVAYVGHSFSAAVGAKLSAVEKRIGSFVLMAGGFANREYVFDEDNAAMVALRKKEGDDRVNRYFEKYPWDDPVYFAPRSSPSMVFLQYGRTDEPLPERVARRDYAHFGEPKRIAFYDAGHELNAAARLDRAKWLASRLRLRRVDFNALSEIPPLK
ncbi:MAG: hypothetical protein KIT09_19925 [Bryobacteraceae bacterium]|nr:hypothetical protein [Bryobacteraceae bacterium]